LTWTLADIRQETRQVTGRLSSDEMTNSEMDQRINDFYTLEFPAELKLEKKLQNLEIITQANVETVPLPVSFTNPVTPALIDNLNILWYQNPITFRNENPQNVSSQTSTGDGVTSSFNFSAQTFPIIPGSVIVTDNVEILVDDGEGILVGNAGGSGTIDYTTGAVVANFAAIPASGELIYFSYKQYQPGRPTAVLYFEEKFTFYPIPDQSYRFVCQGYAIVAPLINATDRPELDEWGPCIVYGASLRIHASNAEWDAYQNVMAIYKRQLALVMRRTHQNLLNERTSPKF